VFLEHLRRPLRADTDLELLERMPADANSVHTTEEPDRYDHLLDCLDCCLEKLDPQDRELILDYYIGEHRAKIESRRNTGAEKNLEQSLALSKQVAEGREEQALALSGLGVLYTRKEDYAKAEELLQRSLDMTWELFGSDHPNVALCLMNIATMHANRGELQRALSEMERAVAINGKALEPDDPSAIRVLDALANL
jgi:tetratricopeptide (TPR) repeat protein